jgi:sulfur carrier protein
MQITLNGKPAEFTHGITVSELIAQLDLGGKRFAVELNGEIVPRSEHASRALDAGDRIEIVHAIGGG